MHAPLSPPPIQEPRQLPARAGAAPGCQTLLPAPAPFHTPTSCAPRSLQGPQSGLGRRGWAGAAKAGRVQHSCRQHGQAGVRTSVPCMAASLCGEIVANYQLAAPPPGNCSSHAH